MEGQPSPRDNQDQYHEHELDQQNEQELDQQNGADQPKRAKTLGIRIDEDLHAQLTFIAQLGGNTIADEIRGAIEQRIATAQADPDLIARAGEVSREIDREAAARQAAISGFLGHTALGASTPVADPHTAAPPATRRPRGTSPRRGREDV